MLRRATRIGYSVLGVLFLLSGGPGIAESAFELEEALDKAVDGATGASTDGGGSEAQNPSTDRPTSGRSGPLSKLSIHGFLTQAWADANFTNVPVGVRPNGTTGPLGPSPDLVEVSLGIPEGGTTNYRDLALQFRYQISDKDIFVVQFSSRTIGESPLQDFSDEIELDWAFYERLLADHTSIKVGRVQIPLGIYNELRDVGTVLPFYRPSSLFYGEGTFTSETVDGVVLTHTFFANKIWSLETSVYGGEWDAINFVPGEVSEISLAKDGYGYQLWLVSPWDVRLGTGVVSFDHEGESFLEPINGRRDIFHASLDALFGRFTLQAEWKEESGVQIDTGVPGNIVEFDVSEWYVLAGFQLTEKLSIYAQAETAFFRGELIPLDINTSGRKQREDVGLALNFSFTPSLILKAEHHWTASRGANRFPDFSTGAFRLRNEIYKADDGSYSIVALAVSF